MTVASEPGSPDAPPVHPSSAPKSARGTITAVIIASLLFVGLAGAVLSRGKAAPEATTISANSRSLVPFSLTSAEGKTVTRTDLDGRFLVVNFVHSSCSFDCRQVNERMAEIQRMVADQDDVRLVSLTVDPRTDKPNVLARFAAEFGAHFDRWMFLTGDKPTLYNLLESSFLSRGEATTLDPIPGGFQDVERIALVDRGGTVREYFPGLSHTTPAAVVDAIDRLRKESVS